MPRRRFAAVAAVGLGLALAPALASAHIERASYWPDPGPETVDGQQAGGAVPVVRDLFTALDSGPPGTTRVVCQSPPTRRQNREVSGAEVDRLQAELDKARKAKTKAKGKSKKKRQKKTKKKKKKKKQRIRSLQQQLTQAEQAYQAALAAENAARQAAEADFQNQIAGNPSMQRLNASLADAVANGYTLRPSEDPIPVTQAEADQLRAFNTQLLAQCQFSEIQAAVTASGNNDRVVVMPGIYTEPSSRRAPTNDPRCDQWEEVNDRPGDGAGGLQTGANTYTYIFNCPNDQNLIAVLGRQPNHDALPPTPLDDRHGIPDLGACIRCNFQIEGSGIGPDDVVIDAGRVESGNGGPAEPAKDVGIRADRADGFALRNMTVRHVREHGIYAHEVDGYMLDRFKTFHTEEYGVLTFTSDHGEMRNCEAQGSGDAGLYPGSAPDTGEQGAAEQGISERFNTEIHHCDMHHNTAGYSGTAANAVHLHHNDFYDNALGFTTDVFTAAGHPGFPQDSDLIENNEFYSNNFNPYVDQPDDNEVIPTIPVPVGTAMWIAGGNANEFRNNHVWDNWRRGSMLFAVPDVFVCGDSPTAGGNQQHGCDETQISTSYRNEFHDNVMSRSPAGPTDPTWPSGADQPDLNGTDFWWDKFPGNTENCWFDNVGSDGTRASLSADPPINPIAGLSSLPVDLPFFLPENCATSVGTSNAPAEAELLSCLAAFDEGAPTPCTWFTTPTEP